MIVRVPIYCYGKEQDYDNERFYAFVDFTAGNSLKFRHINENVSFYVQKELDYETYRILQLLAKTANAYYVHYNHMEKVITILDPVVPTYNNEDSEPDWEDFNSDTTNCNTKKNDEGENMNLKLKDKLFYGEAPHSFGVSFDGRITYKDKAYNADEKALIDTLGLSIQVPLFILPQTEIHAGDVVYIKNPDKDSALYYDGTSFIDYESGQIANYVPTKVFNMSFYSVVKNPLAAGFNGQNPMNNLLPLLLLKDSGRDNNDLFLMMAMSNGGFGNLFGGSQKPTNKTE